jgi:hypothetical protein
MDSDADLARVESRQLPIFSRTAQAVCGELRLTARDARRLHDEGWLSFDPETDEPLDESRETELAFLGALLVAKCTRTVLTHLLAGLRKPYCYDIRRVFFDWSRQQWRLLPGEDDPEGAFFAMMERLRDRRADDVLLNLRGWLEEALDLARDRHAMFAHAGNGFGPGPPRPRDVD